MAASQYNVADHLPTFAQLCDYWNCQISSQNGMLRTDVIVGISKMTLDVIGLAGNSTAKLHYGDGYTDQLFKGFNYQFDALDTEKPQNELSAAFQEIFKSPPRMTVKEIFKNLVPVLPPFILRHMLTQKRRGTAAPRRLRLLVRRCIALACSCCKRGRRRS